MQSDAPQDDPSRPWIRLFQTDPDLVAIPRHESPFLDSVLAGGEFDAELVKVLRDFARDGYVVIDPDVDDFDRRATRIVEDLAASYPADQRRIQDAWYTQDDVRALAVAPKVLDVLHALYGRRPLPFQTLNFDRGTQQATHSDTIHFHTLPGGFMAGVWIALEDMDADNGPLAYFPGSHRLPHYDYSHLVLRDDVEPYRLYEMFVESMLLSKGFERLELEVNRGQALIWAANLFHGGSPIRDPARTRHSQVTHYYFDDCLYYQPLGTDDVGERCFREVVDLRSGAFVPPRHRGVEVDLAAQRRVWRYPRPAPSFVQGLPSID